MITGEIKSKIDQIWNSFWSGGISNPLEVMEQMTYLLFIRRLDEIQITKEKKANRLKTAVEKPIFTPEQDHLRWSKTPTLAIVTDIKCIRLHKLNIKNLYIQQSYMGFILYEVI